MKDTGTTLEMKTCVDLVRGLIVITALGTSTGGDTNAWSVAVEPSTTEQQETAEVSADLSLEWSTEAVMAQTTISKSVTTSVLTLEKRQNLDSESAELVTSKTAKTVVST